MFVFRTRDLSEGQAVVAIVEDQGKIVFLIQFRHALRSKQLALPRGYGEEGLSGEENVVKEIKEEIGGTAFDVLKIGDVVADSGISGNVVEVYHCKVDRITIKKGYEGIVDYILLTQEDVKRYLSQGMITDGFTLAALELLSAR